MKKLITFLLSLFRRKKQPKTFMYDFEPQEETNEEIIFRFKMYEAILKVRDNKYKSILFHNNFSKVAIQHSKDMASKKVISHENWTQRQLMFPGNHIAEILGYNYRSVEGYIDAFLKSEAHKKILLDPTFTHVGIGSAVDVQGKQYLTIIFGK